MVQTMEAMRHRGDCSSMIDYTPGGTVAMGEVIDVGALIGICVTPGGLTASRLAALETCGVFRLIKDGTTGPTFSRGDNVYWDTSTNLAVAALSANTVFAGIADADAGTNEDGVYVEINKPNVQYLLNTTTTTTTTTT